MISVQVKNLKDVIIAGAEFETEIIADKWIAEQISYGEKCLWGRPEWTELVEVKDETKVEIGDEKLEDGATALEPAEEKEPAFKTVVHPAEFTITKTDITAKVAATKAKEIAAKQSADTSKAFLATSTITEKTTIEELRQIVQRLLEYHKASF